MATITIPRFVFETRHQSALDTATAVRQQGWIPARSVNDPRVSAAGQTSDIQARQFYTAVSKSNPLLPATAERWVRPIHSGIAPLRLIGSLTEPLILPTMQTPIIRTPNNNLSPANQRSIIAEIATLTQRLNTLRNALAQAQGSIPAADAARILTAAQIQNTGSPVRSRTQLTTTIKTPAASTTSPITPRATTPTTRSSTPTPTAKTTAKAPARAVLKPIKLSVTPTAKITRPAQPRAKVQPTPRARPPTDPLALLKKLFPAIIPKTPKPATSTTPPAKKTPTIKPPAPPNNKPPKEPTLAGGKGKPPAAPKPAKPGGGPPAGPAPDDQKTKDDAEQLNNDAIDAAKAEIAAALADGTITQEEADKLIADLDANDENGDPKSIDDMAAMLTAVHDDLQGMVDAGDISDNPGYNEIQDIKNDINDRFDNGEITEIQRDDFLAALDDIEAHYTDSIMDDGAEEELSGMLQEFAATLQATVDDNQPDDGDVITVDTPPPGEPIIVDDGSGDTGDGSGGSGDSGDGSDDGSGDPSLGVDGS